MQKDTETAGISSSSCSGGGGEGESRPADKCSLCNLNGHTTNNTQGKGGRASRMCNVPESAGVFLHLLSFQQLVVASVEDTRSVGVRVCVSHIVWVTVIKAELRPETFLERTDELVAIKISNIAIKRVSRDITSEPAFVWVVAMDFS